MNKKSARVISLTLQVECPACGKIVIRAANECYFGGNYISALCPECNEPFVVAGIGVGFGAVKSYKRVHGAPLVEYID